ncbi:YbaN family protein [Marichromatium gracile]|uniref:YbaN family protein n=1 Tax=Marichromatium TaxID=85076 RepID=UPI000F41E9D4|nr:MULTISPECIES: YbaN family protein [Marichromatium]MBO8084904.1 YbaN family protein [Marichromatium sp.]MCF1183046.1 YbaN family protein [Marichromatium gracile]RNE94592.1 DUF454 domain-containing protein [Marichromatium sp. AB32]
MQVSARIPAKLKAILGSHRRQIFNLLAWCCFGLGFVGMLVPLMPTTVFWICAAWLWLRSRPERVRFLIDHPRFGESIRDFLEHGEICPTGKKAAILSMAGSYLIWFSLIGPGLWPALTVATILALVATWIATRPDNRHRRRARQQQAQVRVGLDELVSSAEPVTETRGVSR